MHSFYSILLFLLVASCSFMVGESLKCNKDKIPQSGTELEELEPEDCPYKCETYFLGGSPIVLGCNSPSKTVKPSGGTSKGDYVLTINKTVDGDEITCYRRPYTEDADLEIYCYCATDLCNRRFSPLHDLVFQYGQKVTGNKHFQCFQGNVTDAWQVERTYMYRCENEENTYRTLQKNCGIVYKVGSFHSKYSHSSWLFDFVCGDHMNETEFGTNAKKVTVNGNMNLTCIYNPEKLNKFQCSCDTYGCNYMGSPIHKELLKIILTERKEDYYQMYRKFLPTTTTAATTTTTKMPTTGQPDNKDNENTDPNFTPSEGANKSDEQKDEETTTKGSESYKTALSVIIFVFCILVSRDRHFM